MNDVKKSLVSKEQNVIIAINAIKKIMIIFLGPFLATYFIKISKESMTDLSIYYIFSYILLGLSSFLVAKIIKNKFKIGMFRIGVILNFIYIMAIIILKENIINHLILISILFGLSSGCYWFSYNLFVINKIKNSERTKYTVKSKLVSSIVGILCPVVLGSIITITNYELTAIIILILSLCQVVLSFILTPDTEDNLGKFNLKRTIKHLYKNKQIKYSFLVEFFVGLNVSDGALETVMTILIFNSFKTNMNYGLITSIVTILSMISFKLYGKIYTNKDDKKLIVVSSIIPVLSLLLLFFLRNNITILIYNFCYVIFANILSLTREIRLFNLSDSDIVNRENQVEFVALREGILNLGRILGYSLLLIAGISKSDIMLNIVMVILTLSIFIMGMNIKKIDKFE